ncbi:hypothetical protein MPLSOD_160089 [Mesorhizobium sp. SOD10]|nr:hypothetical protein MPLSOD_160089 [Mesorhizobium sp. SOD10]
MGRNPYRRWGLSPRPENINGGFMGEEGGAVNRRVSNRRIAALQDQGSSPHEMGGGGSAKPRRRGKRPTKAPSPSASRTPPRLWWGRGTQA